MEHNHIRLCHFHFLFVENVEIFQTDVILFVEETLFLNTGHIENIKFRHNIFKSGHFFIRNAFFMKHFCDILGNLQFIRGDEDETDVIITDQCIDQGMHGTAKLQISAQANREMIQSAF